MRKSLVINAIARILVLGIALIVFFGVITYSSLHAYQQSQSLHNIATLVATVEKTASIASDTDDAALANEVAKGLMTNLSLYQVRIESADKVLADIKKPADKQVPNIGKIYSRVLFSPDDPQQETGVIEISADNGFIDAQAENYALFVVLILTATVLLVAFAVGVMVLFTIVQPIQRVSQVIQKIHPHDGQHIEPPRNHEHNEIGYLANSFNKLLDMMAALNHQQITMRQKIEKSELRFRTLVERAATGIFTMNPQGILLSWNPAFASMVDMPASADKTNKVITLFELMPGNGGDIAKLIALAIKQTCQQQQDFEWLLAGEKHWMQMILDVSEHGEIQGILLDITDRKKLEMDALAMACKDPLTGVLNRRGMEMELDALFAGRGADEPGTLTVMLLDLDHFKEANDTYGHEAGDIVLVTTTRRIARILRPSDKISRIGGDEFILLLPGMPIAECEKLANRIIHAISQKIKINDKQLVRIGVSIGIATILHAAEDAESLIKRADAAMYEAKKAGRSRFSVA
jgi:diguanylate cyclase (GGDEF)-like protein/PAS domain S-box-containing protein